MKNLKRCLFAIVAIVSFAACNRASIEPVQLTCEYSADALIDMQNPRLAWINSNAGDRNGAAQSAYRIRVATSPDGFENPVWDTGVVESAESAFITYQGEALKSRTTPLTTRKPLHSRL